MEVETLNWLGPKALWSADPSRSIMEDAAARQPSVYLWAVQSGSDYLANYVGISPSGIARRQQTHVECFLCGKYLTHDPDHMVLGIRKTIHTPDRRNGLNTFLTNYDCMATKLPRVLEAISVFFLPRNGSAVELKRIESALISTFQKQGVQRQPIFDNHGVSIKFSDPKIARLVFPAKIRGMPSEIGI